MWSKDAKKEDSDEESSEEEDSSEEDSDDEAGPSSSSAAKQQRQELTREERRQAKKAQKEAAIAKKKGAVQVGDMPTDDEEDSDDSDDADDAAIANPNHTKSARNQTRIPPKSADDDDNDGGVAKITEGVKKLPSNMSRRERESYEAQQAKERYRKLHEAGKTDEAKADLARLKLIREKREAEAARKAVRIPFPPLCHDIMLIMVMTMVTDLFKPFIGREGGAGRAPEGKEG